MYAGIQEVPPSFAVGVADLETFSWNSAFWVFNWVANTAYSRYSDMIVDIQTVQRGFEGSFLAEQAQIDEAAGDLYKRSPGLARDYLTRYSIERGEKVTARWKKLGEQLLVKYMDGNVKGLPGPRHPPALPGLLVPRDRRRRGRPQGGAGGEEERVDRPSIRAACRNGPRGAAPGADRYPGRLGKRRSEDPTPFR